MRVRESDVDRGSGAERRRTALAIAIVGLAAIASSGCSVDTEPAVIVEPALPPPAASTLTVRWSIDGITDPNECVQAVAVAIEISVVDPFGREVGAWQQSCEVFAVSIPLSPGNYSGSAVLLDGAGQPRTTSVFIDPFTLVGNDTLDVPVDFPASSFF